MKQEMSAAKKIRADLENEVGQLRVSTPLLRKRVANMVERARKASQRHRIKEHVGNYIEMLTHKCARMEFNVQRLHKTNADLLEERDKYVAEQSDLQHTIAALHDADEVDSLYHTTDDEEEIHS